MKKMMLALWLVAMVVAAGCDDVIPARELVKRTDGDAVHTIKWTYYIGSENGCDCFCHEMMGLSASLPCPSVSHKRTTQFVHLNSRRLRGVSIGQTTTLNGCP